MSAFVADLHCHSTASDGTLTPSELVGAAREAGVSLLALTDHDTTVGVAEARVAAAAQGIAFVPGIELSASCRGKPLHVVGLNLEPEHPALLALIDRLSEIRRERAEAIGRRLEKLGVEGAYLLARELAGAAEVTRTHFARVLLDQGRVESMGEAFKRFLGQGKPAYVAADWPALEECVQVIRAAGGVAVLAHPLAYGWTGAWLRRILTAFCEAGGEAIEVVSGNSTPADIALAAGHARRFGLRGSQGSDFHAPGVPWNRLGQFPAMPADITPVWDGWLPSGEI